MRRIAAAVTALALCGTATAAPSADLMPENYRPAADSDEGGLWMMADTLEKNMQSSPLLVRDAALNAYVKGVVCKVAPDRCQDIRIYILDIPHFNASMAPNGAMQVWTGLLLRARNESQLAFILGHEISHYTLRHTLAEWRRARSTAGQLAFFTVFTAGIGGLAYLAAVDSLMAFSRDEERAADAHGFDLAVAAGYDPAQSTALWREVEAEEKADPHKKEEFSFTKTHPDTAERLVTMEKRAAEAEPKRQDWSVGREAYQAAMQPFRTQWLDEDLALGDYEQSITLLDTLLGDSPNSGVLQYYLGEAYRRRNADGDAQKALDAYHAAVAAGDAPTAVYRGLGLTAMKTGDKAAARDAFQKYLAAAPAADDRSMIEYYLSHL